MPKREAAAHEAEVKRQRTRDSSSGSSSSSAVSIIPEDETATVNWQKMTHMHFPTYYNPSAIVDYAAHYKARVAIFIEEYPVSRIRPILSWLFSSRKSTLSMPFIPALAEELEGLTGQRHTAKVKLLAILLRNLLSKEDLRALYLHAAGRRSILSRLHWAIICGEPITEDMKPFIDCHIDYTPAIHFATYLNDYKAVSRLVSLGACVDVANKSQVTASFIAAWCGYSKMIKHLADLGASFDRVVDGGITPLQVAAEFGHAKVVTILLPKLALFSVNLARNDGQTPLLLAVTNNHLAVVEVLLKCSDIFLDQTTPGGETALHIAVKNGHLAMVNLILQKYSVEMVNARTVNGDSALLLAARHRYTEIIKSLMLHGASDGMNVLQGAISLGNIMVVNALFDAGLYIFPPPSWLYRELVRRANYNRIGYTPAKPVVFMSMPMPIGITEQGGSTYLNLAASGDLWACDLLEKYEQRTPGSLAAWVRNADKHNKYSLFCVILNLLSMRLFKYDYPFTEIKFSESETRCLYQLLTLEKSGDSGGSALLYRLVRNHDVALLKKWSDFLASAPEARAFGECFERLRALVSSKIAERMLIERNHISELREHDPIDRIKLPLDKAPFARPWKVY